MVEAANGGFKLNTNGCSRGNPGRAGGGGVLRDDEGKLLLAFSTFFGSCTSIQAEAQTLLFGVNLCISHRYVRVQAEVDSLVLVVAPGVLIQNFEVSFIFHPFSPAFSIASEKVIKWLVVYQMLVATTCVTESTISLQISLLKPEGRLDWIESVSLPLENARSAVLLRVCLTMNALSMQLNDCRRGICLDCSVDFEGQFLREYIVN
ncbi:uncharacterized protein LOC113769087 [Coffea eugenioides]|uniref:uncharacterized protein LOC113769087 n=1 Tax=Coffea eugenioides TaxID=49369 RepID=UPI000F609142|nr:uncharacterized protein LOC113769087 [Coffea eugenioides]